MKKTIFFLGLVLEFITPSLAAANCFLAKESNKIINQEGDCKIRHAPCSTFKIALSLMGYNEKILTDETHPEWLFKEGYVDYIESWKQPHNPKLWIKNSCVWYSQVLTQKLGMSKLQEYVEKFDYGNKDVSGDEGKNNGLTRSWLSSSLQISPEEQIVFLQKLVDNKLPVSLSSQEFTKNILFIEDLENGWKLYGKTGNGTQQNKDRTLKPNLQQGWFVGWIKKDKNTIVFANYIEDTKKQNTYASIRAKADAKEKLLSIINKRSLQ